MNINIVREKISHLKYMSHAQASFLRNFFFQHDIQDVLELGFFQGKSTAYMAAILEEIGHGHITTFDLAIAKNRKPTIYEVLDDLGLMHRVTPVLSNRSFTWELSRLLAEKPLPQFDFCYIDGAHTWDGTGFSFFLVDLMMRPGGWIVLDDLDWTIQEHINQKPKRAADYAEFDEEERTAKGVRMVWDLILPAAGYGNFQEHPTYKWGIAQKLPMVQRGGIVSAGK